jgi:hypothetical protein
MKVKELSANVGDDFMVLQFLSRKKCMESKKKRKICMTLIRL